MAAREQSGALSGGHLKPDRATGPTGRLEGAGRSKKSRFGADYPMDTGSKTRQACYPTETKGRKSVFDSRVGPEGTPRLKTQREHRLLRKERSGGGS